MGLVTQLLSALLRLFSRRCVFALSVLWVSLAIISFASFAAHAAPGGRHGNKTKKAAKDQAPTPEPSFAPVSKWTTPYDGKIVGSIDVEGLKRIEKDAVLAKLTSKIGSPLSATQVSSDVQAVFGMGFFDEIEVQADLVDNKVKMKLVVRERPVIAKVDFQGNERIGTSDLQDVIKVKQWSILDINKVKEDTALIQRHYEEKGFYLAKVTFEVKQTKPDEVELVYKINDYDKVEIKKITFLNNHVFNDEQLKAAFQETKEGGFFSFMSSSGNFKESSFKTDLQRLT
jgi:outer membrane protein insertion porin family